jgi:hypothetical protein
LTGLGVTFLDFSADSSDSPLRAFLLDVCNPEDQDTGLNIHAILGGLGAATGYVLGAMDWTSTFFNFIGNYANLLLIDKKMNIKCCFIENNIPKNQIKL